MVNLYASCLGLQFKILQAFPQTTYQLVQQIIDLPAELEVIKSINLYEVMKSLPNQMIRTGGENGDMLMKGAVPMLFINRYKTQDPNLKAMSDRIFKYLKEALVEDLEGASSVEMQMSEDIFQ